MVNEFLDGVNKSLLASFQDGVNYNRFYMSCSGLVNVANCQLDGYQRGECSNLDLVATIIQAVPQIIKMLNSYQFLSETQIEDNHKLDKQLARVKRRLSNLEFELKS